MPSFVGPWEMLFAALLPLALLLWAIVDLVGREHVRGENKVVWALVIVLVYLLGPLLHLVWGRTSRAEAIS